MALAIGFLLFLLGIVTFIGWLPETLYFLKGFVSFSLLLWGFLALIMGYSQRKADREFQRAVRDDEKQRPAENAAETPQSAL
ncbi:MAG TPA: hypothetical protein VF627_01880 [Abditibacterium sp.]|jgi:hypothetical protein